MTSVAFRFTWARLAIAGSLTIAFATLVSAQTSLSAPKSGAKTKSAGPVKVVRRTSPFEVEQAAFYLRQALAYNPATAAAAVEIEPKDGKLLLKGRVGTKFIHDIVVRTAIDSGFPIGDDLTIDTNEVYRTGFGPPPGGMNATPGYSPIPSPSMQYRPPISRTSRNAPPQSGNAPPPGYSPPQSGSAPPPGYSPPQSGNAAAQGGRGAGEGAGFQSQGVASQSGGREQAGAPQPSGGARQAPGGFPQGQGSPYGYGGSAPAGPGPGFDPRAGGMGLTAPSIMGMNNYVYPPPLFGGYDDPFYGMEPPPISYPPWWYGMSRHRLADAAGFNQPPPDMGPALGYEGRPIGAGGGIDTLNAAEAAAARGGPQANVGGPAAEKAGAATAQAADGSQPAGDTVELIIDPEGVGVLQGTVPTLADKVAIGQKVVNELGVSRVINMLNVRQVSVPDDQNGEKPAADNPPPPPAPAEKPKAGDDRAEAVEKPAAKAAVVEPAKTRAERIRRAIAKRGELSDARVEVTEQDGVATIGGTAPSAYEAMLIYRLVQTTPGVRTVIDRLIFPAPADDAPNPLVLKGRPEEVEAYLLDRIGRELGDSAHVDRVRLLGDRLSVSGRLVDASDKKRVAATIRSMPLLKGIQIEPAFVADE